MRTVSYASALLCLALFAGASPAANAATAWEFLFDIAQVHNDSQYFLHLAVGDAGFPRPMVEPVLPRLRSVESDLPVALYLAKQSDRSLDFIISLRSQGVSWTLIFGKCGVPLDTLYAGMDRDPGPPYGKAWGYWKKHGRAVWVPDPDVVALVQLQLGGRFAGVPVIDVAAGHGRGTSVYAYVADRKGRPWRGQQPRRGPAGNDQGEDRGGGHGQGHDHGKGKGHGK